jgi:hypothetical protein
MLDRAELPVDTARLARFLIGKMLMRMLAEGVADGASSRPRHMASANPRVTPIAA